MSQLDLFVDPLPEPDPRLERLARAVPAHVRFGTSSWTFDGWKGLVYRKRYGNRERFVKESLREYAAFPLFRTVGVDRSYYAPLREDEWADYAAQLPDGFVCCSKVWSEITTRVFPDHPRYADRAGQPNRFFLDARRLADHVAAPLRAGLGAHVGPLIVELTPSPHRTHPRALAEAIDRFLGAVPDDLHYAFELREPQLLTERYLDVLRAHPHASHLLNLHTRMPPIGRQLDMGALVADVCVARLMIPPGKRYGELQQAFAPFDRIHAPQPDMRRDVLRLIRETGERGAELYVIANNKAEGSSPLTVIALAELLSGSSR